MHYDLALLAEMCIELGLRHQLSEETLDVSLEDELVFRFTNYVEKGLPDCACGFKDTASHNHGDPVDLYTDRARAVLSSLDVLTGLVDGTVLVWERWSDCRLQDRSMIHKHFRESYEYLEPGDEYRIRRIRIVRESDQESPAGV